MVTRILRDDPGKSSMHNVSSPAPKDFKESGADETFRGKQ